MAATVINITGLSKFFGRTYALNDFDLQVVAGDVHGFLGPNGAGKTTTLRILLGMLHADAGQVTLLGGDPWRDAVALHARLAYVPGDVALWPQLTGGEVLDLFAKMHGNTNVARQKTLIERFDLDVRKKSHTYSKGNRQKVALIAALACDVELLLLDEPTSGLDPLMEVVFRECVRDAQACGRTVLLSSHMLSEVEALCNQVTIVRAGTRVVHGSLADLRSMTTSQIVATLPVCDLSTIAGVSDIHWQGATVRCQVTATGLAPLMSLLATQGVQQLTVQPPSLEDIFLQHYQQTTEVLQ